MDDGDAHDADMGGRGGARKPRSEQARRPRSQSAFENNRISGSGTHREEGYDGRRDRMGRDRHVPHPHKGSGDKHIPERGLDRSDRNRERSGKTGSGSDRPEDRYGREGRSERIHEVERSLGRKDMEVERKEGERKSGDRRRDSRSPWDSSWKGIADRSGGTEFARLDRSHGHDSGREERTERNGGKGRLNSERGLGERSSRDREGSERTGFLKEREGRGGGVKTSIPRGTPVLLDLDREKKRHERAAGLGGKVGEDGKPMQDASRSTVEVEEGQEDQRMRRMEEATDRGEKRRVQKDGEEHVREGRVEEMTSAANQKASPARSPSLPGSTKMLKLRIGGITMGSRTVRLEETKDASVEKAGAAQKGSASETKKRRVRLILDEEDEDEEDEAQAPRWTASGTASTAERGEGKESGEQRGEREEAAEERAGGEKRKRALRKVEQEEVKGERSSTERRTTEQRQGGERTDRRSRLGPTRDRGQGGKDEKKGRGEKRLRPGADVSGQVESNEGEEGGVGAGELEDSLGGVGGEDEEGETNQDTHEEVGTDGKNSKVRIKLSLRNGGGEEAGEEEAEGDEEEEGIAEQDDDEDGDDPRGSALQDKVEGGGGGLEEELGLEDEDEMGQVAGVGSSVALTARQRALQSIAEAAVEFPEGLVDKPGKKKSAEDTEAERLLKREEAARKRRQQVEKAARESQAAAIQKILGQDSTRKRREEKILKQRAEAAQEKEASEKEPAQNSVRVVHCPQGTVVSWSRDAALPPCFHSKAKYPPPREKCAGPTCANPFRYRDSVSRLPLCSLHCYKAVKNLPTSSGG